MITPTRPSFWKRDALLRSDRLALLAFGAYVAAAWFVLVFGIGSTRWFLRDDWSFLAGRDGGSLHDLFAPHDVHPSVLPIIAFRLMYRLFGLRFTPYLILIVTMHLAVACMLRVVMRRAGVGPWVASAAAGLLVLFGPGEQNILWAFQINFVGSTLLGLVQLVLADHDGPFRRRDVIGALAGVAAVMTSGIGPLMVVAVGIATLLRRGWRVAACHTAPAALAYGTWFLLANPHAAPNGRAPVSEALRWVREGELGTVDALGHVQVVAVLLGLLLVLGLGVHLATTTRAALRSRTTATFALLACGPLFFLLISQSRWTFGLELARSGRYLYMGSVMLLPSLALAADAVARRWRPTTAVIVVLLLAGAPGNVGEFNSTVFNAAYFKSQRAIVLGLPRDPLATKVPRSVHPLPQVSFDPQEVTIGWLLDASADGKVPAPTEIDPKVEATFPILLGVASVDEPFAGTCRKRAKPIRLSVEPGDRLAIRTRVLVVTLVNGRRTSPPVQFNPFPNGTLEIGLPLELRFSAVEPGGSFTLCR